MTRQPNYSNNFRTILDLLLLLLLLYLIFFSVPRQLVSYLDRLIAVLRWNGDGDLLFLLSWYYITLSVRKYLFIVYANGIVMWGPIMEVTFSR